MPKRTLERDHPAVQAMGDIRDVFQVMTLSALGVLIFGFTFKFDDEETQQDFTKVVAVGLLLFALFDLMRRFIITIDARSRDSSPFLGAQGNSHFIVDLLGCVLTMINGLFKIANALLIPWAVFAWPLIETITDPSGAPFIDSNQLFTRNNIVAMALGVIYLPLAVLPMGSTFLPKIKKSESLVILDPSAIENTEPSQLIQKLHVWHQVNRVTSGTLFMVAIVTLFSLMMTFVLDARDPEARQDSAWASKLAVLVMGAIEGLRLSIDMFYGPSLTGLIQTSTEGGYKVIRNTLNGTNVIYQSLLNNFLTKLVAVFCIPFIFVMTNPLEEPFLDFNTFETEANFVAIGLGLLAALLALLEFYLHFLPTRRNWIPFTTQNKVAGGYFDTVQNLQDRPLYVNVARGQSPALFEGEEVVEDTGSQAGDDTVSEVYVDGHHYRVPARNSGVQI